MFQTSKFILPYEPGYTGHWEAERRRKETREWLRQREREIAAPSIVPEMPERDAPGAQIECGPIGCRPLPSGCRQVRLGGRWLDDNGLKVVCDRRRS
jgi:hypothetical protein